VPRRARMVLGHFAERKWPRLMGRGTGKLQLCIPDIFDQEFIVGRRKMDTRLQLQV